MTAILPDIMAAVLKEANCSLPLSLTASVNRNGAVTLTANPYTLSSAYSLFFDAMTKKLNQSFPVGNNPFLVFREAPTSVEHLIHNLPLSIVPDEPADLFPSLLESIGNAIDIPIFVARFLQSDPSKRAAKRTTWVVIVVDPLHVSRFGESIRLFSGARTVTPAYSTSKSTQCRKVWRFGHSAPLCKEEAQACPICTLLHHRSAHRCANQSCPKGGFEKSVVGCCNASPPLCVNSGGQHASLDGTCPVGGEILSSLPPPRDQDIPDAPAPDADPLQTTPQGPTARPTVPATPARHAPVSLPLVSLPGMRQSNLFAVHLPSLPSLLPFPAGIFLVLVAPSSVLAPVPTGASPLRPTTTWNFKCPQAQPQHRVLHHPNHSIILVV